MEQKHSCIDCGSVNCNKMQANYPPFCLTTNIDPALLESAMEEYNDPMIRSIAIAAADVETEN